VRGLFIRLHVMESTNVSDEETRKDDGPALLVITQATKDALAKREEVKTREEYSYTKLLILQ